MQILRVLCPLLLVACAAWAQSQASVDPAASSEGRIENLEDRLLAPCCWSEPVSQHRSEVALEMKVEIREMVGQGRSDREILDYYIGRYGQRILIEPEGELSTWIHVVPVVVLIAGLALVVLVIRKLAMQPPPSST